MGSSFEQCIDIGRTHDGPVTHERLVVVLDAVMVVEIVDHDAEGFLDRTACGVAEPIDPFEPRAVAEVKARYRVDAASRESSASRLCKNDHGRPIHRRTHLRFLSETDLRYGADRPYILLSR